MQPALRYFRSIYVLTLPQSLQVGPGATHVRVYPGENFALEEAKCTKESRFVNGRLRAGDLVEITAAEYDAATATPTPVKALKGKD